MAERAHDGVGPGEKVQVEGDHIENRRRRTVAHTHWLLPPFAVARHHTTLPIDAKSTCVISFIRRSDSREEVHAVRLRCGWSVECAWLDIEG